MKIAILGGGFTGLTAAYYLQKKGNKVVLFEKEPVLGGLAVGFKGKNWDWYLERAYHHLFANDYEILNFAKETGFNKIFLNTPETMSLYDNDRSMPANEFSIISLDSPIDLLKFPYLSFPQKIRAGVVLAFLKVSPFFSFYEKETAEEFLKKTMGDRAWISLWQELFRKKFGKSAGIILSSFIWARIHKRTKKLAYIKGGFQTLINHIEEINKQLGIELKKACTVENIVKKGEKFELQYKSHPESLGRHPERSEGSRDKLREGSSVSASLDSSATPQNDNKKSSRQARTINESFDVVISTLPSPILSKVAGNILPEKYLSRFKKLKFLHAVVLILETKEPILEKAYWLNICTNKLDVMGVMQHTNMVDKKHYNNNHILYAANYVDIDHPLIKMSDKEVYEWYLPQLEKIRNSKFEIRNYYVFKGPFAQPIFDRDFLENKPAFTTPVKNFYIANLDMTYPYDRGTNYAVKLGKEVAELVTLK